MTMGGHVMVHSMCHVDQATGYPDNRSDNIRGVSGRRFLDWTNI